MVCLCAVCCVRACVCVCRSDATKNEHLPVGKAKIGLRSTQLILYTKNETLAQLALSSTFGFTIQNGVYGSFYDDDGQNWSLLFKSAEAVEEFSVRLACAKLAASGNAASMTQDVVVGTLGKLDIDVGDTLGIYYTGWLAASGGGRGQQFDTNNGSGRELKVRLGERDVVVGLENGLVGMRKGGRRFIVIPPQLA